MTVPKRRYSWALNALRWPPVSTRELHKLPPGVLNLTYDLNEDIATVCGLGLQVDDDWEPALENIPSPSNNRDMDPTTGIYSGQQWQCDDMCK